MPHAIAIDWSGDAKGAAQKIWIAEAEDCELLLLEGGRDRTEVVEWLCSRRDGAPVVAGVDFAFSFPAWFLDEHGCRTVDEAWRLAAEDGEAWLRDCPPPFWGKPERKRGPEQQLRACEEGWRVGGIAPKSVFQIGGAGAVGTGSLRGMPHLPELRDAGWAIWPFERAGTHAVAEIWPRLLTGPIAKSSKASREAWLDRHAALHPVLRERAAGSEDAFDAAASAIVLSRSAALDAALAAPPPGDPREGAMLVPADAPGAAG